MAMKIFEAMAEHGHEELVFWYDRATGLKAIVAIHDTTLGPALGGCRMWPYANEDEALTDVLRLSRGMTYKNAAMGLDLGGGKSVIWADSRTDKTEAMFRGFGRLVQSLGGRYITAEDVGVSADDMAIVARETRFVGGLRETSGDPSPATALGVLEGIRACLRHVFGSDEIEGRRVAIQGLGHVGAMLARMLRDQGAQLTITDINPDRVAQLAAELGADSVDPDRIFDVECDVFSPCALGAILNDDTIPRLSCRIVAGSANNQLKEPRHGQMLRDRGIVYAPDFVINGGGVVNVADEFHPDGYHHDRAYERIAQIGRQVADVIAMAERQQIPSQEAADRLALARLEVMGQVRRTYIPE
jgi:leucine dehydrogenase